jgi:hypothetical protein
VGSSPAGVPAQGPSPISSLPKRIRRFLQDVAPAAFALRLRAVLSHGKTRSRYATHVTNGRVYSYAMRGKRDPFFGPDGFTVDCLGYVFGAGPVEVSIMIPDARNGGRDCAPHLQGCLRRG